MGNLSINIALLGYKDFIDLTKGIIKNSKYQASINVFQCLLDECLPILPQLENNQTDIIITGRANQKFLETRTEIPIVTLHITPFDILAACKKSLQYSNNIAIALATFEDLEYDYSILQDLLNINLTFISYETEEELRLEIKRFSAKKGVIIGTSVAVRIAKENGIPGVLIHTLENSVNKSIEHAIEIIKFKEVEEKNNKQFKAIIDSVQDGIIATNDHDEITLMNKPSWDLLQLPPNPKKISFSSVFDDKVPAAIFKDHDFQDKIIKINNKSLNLNRETILVRGKKAGYVFTLQDITQIQRIEKKYRLENEAKGLIAKTHFHDIISINERMKKTLENAIKYSQTDSTVLIEGETGTGKELVAQSIHNTSKRSSFPFVAINCAALPESLLESELFGYIDGAFTGAAKGGKKGLFEIAHGGTIFLDEINSISLYSQARLLRVLQEKEVARIGSEKVIPINVRIIAATNQNLSELVQDHKFRVDLYYRLNVLKLSLPPLRNRLEDLYPLSEQFFSQNYPELYEKLKPLLFDLCQNLFHYSFPGNIRQLFNIFERFAVLCDISSINLKDCLTLLRECVDDKPKEGVDKISFVMQENYKDSLLQAEKSLLLKYLEISKGDKTSIAKKLGIGKTTLYRKLKELEIIF